MQTIFEVLRDKTTFLQLLSALLLEFTIVCYGNIQTVSQFIMGLESLARPFQWQMCLIPVLPTVLFDKIDAPLPLLVGITD